MVQRLSEKRFQAVSYRGVPVSGDPEGSKRQTLRQSTGVLPGGNNGVERVANRQDDAIGSRIPAPSVFPAESTYRTTEIPLLTYRGVGMLRRLTPLAHNCLTGGKDRAQPVVTAESLHPQTR